MRNVIIIAILLVTFTTARAKVRVVSSTADLGSIAALVGGDKVKVDVIARGNADPHYVELLPSYMVKVARAKLYLKVGAGLDYWAGQIIDGSGNGVSQHDCRLLTYVYCTAEIGWAGGV